MGGRSCDVRGRAALDDHLTVNLLGTYAVTQAFLSQLTRWEEPSSTICRSQRSSLAVHPAYRISKAHATRIARWPAQATTKKGRTTPMSDTTDRKILVTGATGLAGSAVIREFVRNEYPVRALVRNRAKARPFEAFPIVELVDGDMSRSATLEQALSGVDRVLLISSPDPQMTDRQSSFIDAAKTAGVRHVVKFSGLSGADVGTPFVFGSMHAEVER
jgi:NAD(P)-dependent dehydrogenase (short-subunit alcohol dehydrogenase family)